ncbi:phytanoyl-CoA dioxygenase family protein [Hyaloscypha variabilis F]|uniref:Phytanoyl-CoA dioxygenase family protein n=1 Tax=Hyaloscypha variabilis (strain UAMH 11265 / GT02V1 / F) TaxID=1149755 RepID=A0A2J6QUB3_HYAVF|nr:phytanoyl-CoA dioxygenase family protein [Hyaloscypha variabilis F]
MPKTTPNGSAGIPSRLFSIQSEPSLSAFRKICSRTATKQEYPLAAEILSNVPIYNLSRLDINDEEVLALLQSEWHHLLLSGPGALVLKNMYPDKQLIEKVNRVYQGIIESEKQNSRKGDHFASSSANDRIWNSFSKHCLSEPEPLSFVEYYSNPWLALICEAWLGPGYRITSQVNVVKPGGAAQVSHRDYHLGFQTAEACEKFPIATQIASQLLTLQGAVAHSDMPVESGPTRLLPFSQRFDEGYMAYRLPHFTEYFLENYVSLPLSIGDGLFFNPALFHAAGENITKDIQRTANLLQVSSAFAKPMETIDTYPLIEKCWDLLRDKFRRDGESVEVRAFVAAVAEGYPFPTNLDRRPPAPGGMAPESEQQLLMRGVKGDWDLKIMLDALEEMKQSSKA